MLQLVLLFVAHKQRKEMGTFRFPRKVGGGKMIHPRVRKLASGPSVV